MVAFFLPVRWEKWGRSKFPTTISCLRTLILLIRYQRILRNKLLWEIYSDPTILQAPLNVGLRLARNA